MSMKMISLSALLLVADLFHTASLLNSENEPTHEDVSMEPQRRAVATKIVFLLIVVSFILIGLSFVCTQYFGSYVVKELPIPLAAERSSLNYQQPPLLPNQRSLTEGKSKVELKIEEKKGYRKRNLNILFIH